MADSNHSFTEEKIILYAEGLKIVVAPGDKPPFEVQAMAFEQDTFLIMDDPLREKYSDETKAELISEMSDTLPVPPGNIVIRGEKVPFRFLAIVYDVSQEPSWREEWVVIALNEIFRESEYRQLQSLGLQMLGTLHGGLPRERFFALLGAAVKRASFPHLKYLWVIT